MLRKSAPGLAGVMRVLVPPIAIAFSILLAAGAANAQQITVATAGQPTSSGPICGGIVSGKAQPRCGAKPAFYEGAAAGTCPPGSFLDVGLWQCWSCPAGSTRTAAAVDTDRACSKPDKNIRGAFGRAQYRGPLCPPGSFHDPIRGGECWSCPSGYQRSAAHIDATNACFVPAREDFRSINRHNRATGVLGTDCPGGQFWDAIDGHCYSCPSGFKRTGHAIRDHRACARAAAEQQAKATVVKKAQCEAGEIHDLKIPGQQNAATGGGCWKCAQAWDRTAFPIDGAQACEKGGGLAFARAKMEAALTCPAGQHFDFIGVSQGELNQLVSSKSAKPGSKAAQSGTCWSCPKGFKRSASSVKSGQACEGMGIEWRTAAYPEPGLFALAGAQALALELLRDRKAIDAAIEELAKATQSRHEEATKAFWEEIRTEPENSPILKAAVLAAVLAAVEEPGKATAAQQAAAQGFAAYIRVRRTYIAQDALAAYDAWAASDRYWRAQDKSGPQNMAMLIDTGTAPPDFYEIAHAGAFAGLATGAGLGTAFTIAMANKAVFEKVFPFARRTAMRALERAKMRFAQQAFERAGVRATQQAIKEGVKGTAKSLQKLGGALKALSSVGPQIIITIAAEIVAMEIEKQIAIADARPKLLTALASARQAPQLNRMIDSDEGYGQLTGFWSLATSGRRKPSSQAAKEIAAIAGPYSR